MTPDLERISADAYLAELSTLPLPEVREMRADCQRHENATSYVRRLTQGRVDIVGGELARRREGGDPEDLGELIGKLPDILADHHAGSSGHRPPLELEPDDDLVAALQARLDEIVAAGHLSSLGERSDADLDWITAELQSFENEISVQRRMLHDRIDRLQAEITRRYRDGEASVDSLLN